MKRIMNSIPHYLERIPDQVRKRKLLVVLLFLGVIGLSMAGIARLKMDMTLEGWFLADDPVKVAFDAFHEQFGSEDGLYIVYKPKDGDVFSAKSLAAARGIREDLLNYRQRLKEGEDSPLKHIMRINGLDNAPVLSVEGDRLVSKPLVKGEIPTSSEELEKIRETAKSQRTFPLLYFSKDMEYGGLFAETDFGVTPLDTGILSAHTLSMTDMVKPAGEDKGQESVPFKPKPTDQADYVALMDEVKKVLEKPEYADHLEYFPVGNTAAGEYDAAIAVEMGQLYLAALIIMIVLLWFLFRSLSAVLCSMLIVILSTIITMGITGLLGFTVTGFLMLTLLLILTVGMADSVHIMSGYLFFRKEGLEHPAAMRASFAKAGSACLLTALTTVLAMLALAISDVVPIIVFSIMSAMGVAVAYLLTIFLLPLLLDLWSPVPKAAKAAGTGPHFIGRFIPNFSLGLQKGLEKIVPSVEKRPFAFIAPFLAVFVICIYGTFQVKIDSNILDQYPADSKFRQSVGVVDKKMMGAYKMTLYMDLKKENAMHDPEVLSAIDRLQRLFEGKYSKYVVNTSSIADIVKDSYQKLNEGREEMYVIPAEEKTVSQTLFLFNNANPVDRSKLVDDNYRKTNITISLRDFGTYEYSRVFAEMQEDIRATMDGLQGKYGEAQVSITGIFVLAQKAGDYLTRNEIQSFSIALAAISIILLAAFGSFQAGLLALIPNLIPSLLTSGLLGMLGISLDFFTMMLAPIIIGISVDDTVHFISHYRMELRELGGNVKQALQRTMKEAGQGIVFTSMILGLGFGIMSIASAAGTRNMGKFGFLAILAGLLCDLLLLPALILVKSSLHKEPVRIPVEENELVQAQ